MSWLEHHQRSEKLASGADVARYQDDRELAKRLYGKAAEAEVRAIDALDPSERSTLGITAVSAVALYYKAGQLLPAEKTAYHLLGLDQLPNFARMQLRDLLHAIWAEQRDASQVALPSDQVNVAMSGDDILMGGAPIGAVARCVEVVRSLVYRVAEFIRGVDHRPTGPPNPEILAACRPWILHVPSANYQFAVTIEDSVGQRELFGGDSGPCKIVDTFIDILRASAGSPEEELPRVVPARDYQHTFLRLTGDLSPNESHQLSVWSPRHPEHISLDYTTRARTRAAMNNTAQEPMGPQAVKGILRAVDLDRGHIVVRHQQSKYKIDGIGNTLDDTIGAMVNRPVTVQAEAISAKKLMYNTIEAVDSTEQELGLIYQHSM